MEIMVEYETRETFALEELMPKWWGIERYLKEISHSITVCNLVNYVKNRKSISTGVGMTT